MNQNYEDNFHRLKSLVEQIERGEMGLEDSLALFEEGMALVSTCEHQLSQVEEKIKVLSSEGDVSIRGELPIETVSDDVDILRPE